MLSVLRLQVFTKSSIIQSTFRSNGLPCLTSRWPLGQNITSYTTAANYRGLQQQHRQQPYTNITGSLSQHGLLSCAFSPNSLISVRHDTNFFNKHTADQLWKGVVSVSKHGAKKGRGSGRAKKPIKNLNKGQIIGKGPVNMVWPGLNTLVVRGAEMVHRQQLEPDPEHYKKLQEIRDTMERRKRRKLSPLERGWSGYKMGGRKMGPPDPIGEDNFDGFETICLEYKIVSTMKTQGRMRKVSVFSVTGNGNGLAGFALAKAPMPQAARRVSKKRAAQHLVQIPIYEDHTVMHDFYSQFGITKMFVKKMHKGYGLVCHRAIKAICEIIGIKDIYVKIEGSVNIQNLTKAFFLGLIKQKSFQQMAEEKGLHVVEIKNENFDYPKLLASPVRNPLRTEKDIKLNEDLNFDTHVMDGRVKLDKIKSPSYMTYTDGWQTYLRKLKTRRNRHIVTKDLILNYGGVQSFHHDKHPECTKNYFAHRKTRKYDAHKSDKKW